MPMLPGLDIPTQAQLDRIAATFPGTTTAEKIQAYKDWLTNRLIDRVQTAEAEQIEATIAAHRAELMEQLAASLPPRRPEAGMSVGPIVAPPPPA